MEDFEKDSFVKIVGISGNFRYGYIYDISDDGFIIEICLEEEGDSAIEYEAAFAQKIGWEVIDWDKQLTGAEKRLIPLFAENLPTKNIAETLGISPVTVRSQRKNLITKLQLDNVQQLVVLCQGLDKRFQRKD